MISSTPKDTVGQICFIVILLSLAGIVTVLLTGCNTTLFSETKPDGTKISIKNSRVFWSSESYTCQFSTNGASLSASKSTVDSAAISAATQGAINGMASAITAGVIKP